MKQKTKFIISSLLLVILSSFAINAFAVFVPPAGPPLSQGIDVPINSGDALQYKSGGFIAGFLRVIGFTLLGGNLEVDGQVKILGGNPGLNKVLVSDAVGVASWVDPKTLGVGGGGTVTGGAVITPVSLGGTGLSSIPANSIWVANSPNVISTLTAHAGESIRLNAAGTAWETYTPINGNGFITGSGTTNTISKFTSGISIGNSSITDDGTTVTIPNLKLNQLIFATLVPVLNSSNATDFELGNATHFLIAKVPGDPTTVIQGFAPPSGSSHVHGRVVYITNQTSNTTITIKNNSSNCASQNRVQFSDNNDHALGPLKTVMLMYDSGFPGGPRWRELLSN